MNSNTPTPSESIARSFREVASSHRYRSSKVMGETVSRIVAATKAMTNTPVSKEKISRIRTNLEKAHRSSVATQTVRLSQMAHSHRTDPKDMTRQAAGILRTLRDTGGASTREKDDIRALFWQFRNVSLEIKISRLSANCSKKEICGLHRAIFALAGSLGKNVDETSTRIIDAHKQGVLFVNKYCDGNNQDAHIDAIEAVQSRVSAKKMRDLELVAA